MHRKSLSRFFVLALAVMALMMLVGSVAAAEEVVTPSNPQGWISTANSNGGSSAITNTAPRNGVGSVELTGDRTRWIKAVDPTTGAKLGDLSAVTDFAFDWAVAADSVSNLGENYTPALRLHVFDPDATNKFSELIWEGAYNGPVIVTKGVWETTDMIGSSELLWRWVTGVGETLDNGALVNQTLSSWSAAPWYGPNAVVFAISVGVGSSVGADYHAFSDNVVLGFDNAPTTYNFEPDNMCGTGDTFFLEPFDVNPPLSDTQAPGVWYTDRYNPAVFESAFFDGDNRLHVGISASDYEPNGSAWHNYQGRKFDLNNGVMTYITADLYVGSDWDTEKRHASLWATTTDLGGDISGYPIFGFTAVDANDDPVGFRIFSQDTDLYPDNGITPGWIDVGFPSGFQYGAWYTIRVELHPDAYRYYINGQLVLVDPITFDSIKYDNLMVQAYNYGEDYDVYWDNIGADYLCPPSVTPTGPTEICDPGTVDIQIGDVEGLYGYEFIVEYDEMLVSAVGSFDQTWFDGVSGFADGWNADCLTNPGECRFASTRQSPQAPISTAAPETVANITFTSLLGDAGSFPVKVRDIKLTDKNSFEIPGAIGGSLTVNVCGTATVSGKISLQGRPQPGRPVISDGPADFSVQLINGPYGPYTVTPNLADGTFTITGVRYDVGGSTYDLIADHSVYLRAEKSLLVNGNVTGQKTKLLGGDANDDGHVFATDLTCIGGQFGATGLALTCSGAATTPDVNDDFKVNIQDLSLAAGNYNLPEPQGW